MKHQPIIAGPIKCWVYAGLSAVFALAGCEEKTPGVYGYMEGHYRLLAPPVSGRLETVADVEGKTFRAGDVIAALNTDIAAAELAEARAQVAAATARLDDARQGGRAPEIDAALDRVRQARAERDRARKDYNRIKPLYEKGVVSKSRLDSAEAALNQARGALAEREQDYALIQLPARTNALAALDAYKAAAEARVARLEAQLDQRRVRAPAPGLIERVLREPGEMAGRDMPVARFLADRDARAILFVAQGERQRWTLGRQITLTCDGCDAPLSAAISFVATQPEYTSPLIFSDEERESLMYRLEASFDDDAAASMPAPGTAVWVKETPAVKSADHG